MDLQFVSISTSMSTLNKEMNTHTYQLLISRKARDTYGFTDSFFSLKGNVIFGNLYAVRQFAHIINKKRDLVSFPETAVKTSDINAIGLIHELVHYIFALYKDQADHDVTEHLATYLDEHIEPQNLEKAMKAFVNEFPPPLVYQNKMTIDEYLTGITNGIPNKSIIIEELVDLWLGNLNPAFNPYLELFDYTNLEKSTDYDVIVGKITEFFDQEPRFGPDNQSLITMLQSFTGASPHSIKGQLEFIAKRWGSLLGKWLFRVLSCLDIYAEEEKMRGLGAGETVVYQYTDLGNPNYTQDREWMPNVVMIAKNCYVWLDQLSKKYKRAITNLDQIPDEELDQLSRWGFTALWLIGVWERSKASKQIKKWCGNLDAEASAYSLYDYVVATDLGSYESYKRLKDRAWSRGIRLAADMVPNHVGIDSKWVIEHPDWFVSLPYAPFPSYSYSGQSVSNNSDVQVFVEDHYFSRSDAAVTFKRYDRRNGDTRFVYHGNDGTQMPWNDTAQINFLHPEAREAVIQTILHVARMFPIIRFDAAMTLTKKHYQRLWFPAPGTGGDIPSRSEHGINNADFHKAMPEEFWREVVDRINREAPDTLLLAEAFWLLEGFFVRTLGMHRVYNSAFMHMLRNEDNAKYRSVIKNTLEYDPEILKRFVNFMNNPDEETAVKQFGKGEKYFGVCLLCITLPGLPMFGHGQVEGFAEKYGMEYRKAYWNEQVDNGLLKYHEQSIFPVMKKRYLFADVHNFLLYDFWIDNTVNEDVFAYSNGVGDERAVIIYNNRYNETKGHLRHSVGFAASQGGEKRIIQRHISEGLNIRNDGWYYCIYKDQMTGLEHIKNCNEICEKGFYIELRGYQSMALMDFRQVHDNEWQHYAHVRDYLGGRGVPNIEEALKTVIFQPLHQMFKEVANVTTYKAIIKGTKPLDDKFLNDVRKSLQKLFKEIKAYANTTNDEKELIEEIISRIVALMKLKTLTTSLDFSIFENSTQLKTFIEDNLLTKPNDWIIALSWTFIHLLGKIITETDYEMQSRTWVDEWLLGRIVEWTIRQLAKEREVSANEDLLTIKVLITHQNWFFELKLHTTTEQAIELIKTLFSDPEVQNYLHINRYQNVLFFNKEYFENLMRWLFISTLIIDLATDQVSLLPKQQAIIQVLLKTAEESGFKVDTLLEKLRNI